MEFIYNDGGRAEAGFKGNAGDCVVRAIAIASGLPYPQIYNALSSGCKTQKLTKRSNKQSSARNGVYTNRKWFKDYMRSLGFTWTPTMQIGSGCKVHLIENELPKGRLVVSVSKHYTCVIDGVIYDTYNPSDRGVTIYPPNWPNFPGNVLPKSAFLLENGNGWAYAPERCVYGYWKLAT